MINTIETPSFSMWLTFRCGDTIICEAALSDLITCGNVGNAISYTDELGRNFDAVITHRRDAYTMRGGRVYTVVHLLADIPPALMTETNGATR
jgi:hypothetical protein